MHVDARAPEVVVVARIGEGEVAGVTTDATARRTLAAAALPLIVLAVLSVELEVTFGRERTATTTATGLRRATPRIPYSPAIPSTGASGSSPSKSDEIVFEVFAPSFLSAST